MKTEKVPSELPGSLWLNHGQWWWAVKLPGTEKRKSYPLKPPGSSAVLREGRGKSVAEAVAWRMWERASREAAREKPVATASRTVEDVVALYMAWARDFYVQADEAKRPTGQVYNAALALRLLRARLGSRDIDSITYHDVREARDALVGDGKGLARDTINMRLAAWKRFFAWALENRYCSAATKAEASAVAPLPRHRSKATDGEPQTPVAHRHVKAILPYLHPDLQAMVRVQELCGARPGEMCIMRPCDIERKRDVWLYRPSRHKNSFRDLPRVVYLGPRSQALLSPLLERTAATGYLFNPAVTQADRRADRRASRKSRSYHYEPVPDEHKRHRLRDHYGATTYGQAIGYAIAAAQAAGKAVEHWSPNQLRHACATRVRRRFGVEAARIMLGHSGGRAGGSPVTDRYTRTAIEREELRLILPVIRLLG